MNTGAVASEGPSRTLILDRIVPPPAGTASTTKHQRAGYALAFGLVALAVAWIFLMFQSSAVYWASSTITEPARRFIDRLLPGDADVAEFVWIVLSPWVAIAAGIVIHETGHVIAGMVLGFRLVHVRVGPLSAEC